MAGAPEVVRVGSDDRVWTLIRHNGHTRLARLEGRMSVQTLSSLPTRTTWGAPAMFPP